MIQVLNECIKCGDDMYCVSKKNLILLSICSYGLYTLYWIYKSWNKIHEDTDEDFSPAIRTWLFPIYNFYLFNHIKKESENEGIAIRYNIVFLSILYLFLFSGWYAYMIFPSVIFTFVAIMPLNNSCILLNEKNKIFDDVIVNSTLCYLGGALVILSLVGWAYNMSNL